MTRRAIDHAQLLADRWAITDAGRTALAEHPRCAVCGEPAGGEAFVASDIGSRWLPKCTGHLDASGNSVTRRWPE